MAKHHPDLVMCRKQPGVAIGRLCEKCKHQIIFRKVIMIFLVLFCNFTRNELFIIALY
jgi:hypothetical protein